MGRLSNAGSDAGGGAIHRTRDEWIDWCWERNQRAIGSGWRRWLMVRDVNHGDGPTCEVQVIEGEEVGDIWLMLEDKPLVPFRWTSARIHRLLGLTQWRLERGMSAEAFMFWSAEHRRRKRAEFVDREIRLGARVEGELPDIAA